MGRDVYVGKTHLSSSRGAPAAAMFKRDTKHPKKPPEALCQALAIANKQTETPTPSPMLHM
jgi:hypothetical protein